MTVDDLCILTEMLHQFSSFVEALNSTNADGVDDVRCQVRLYGQWYMFHYGETGDPCVTPVTLEVEA